MFSYSKPQNLLYALCFRASHSNFLVRLLPLHVLQATEIKGTSSGPFSFHSERSPQLQSYIKKPFYQQQIGGALVAGFDSFSVKFSFSGVCKYISVNCYKDFVVNDLKSENLMVEFCVWRSPLGVAQPQGYVPALKLLMIFMCSVHRFTAAV